MLLKQTAVVPILSLLSLALAAPFEHHKHFRHAKRDADVDVVTVTVQQNQNSVYEQASSDPVVAASSAAYDQYQYEPQAASSSAAYGPVYSSGTPAGNNGYQGASSATTAQFSSAPSSSSTSSPSDGSVGSYAQQGKGISYSPYSNDGACKSSSEIQSDMATLSSFSVIRIYAPDCSVVSAMLSSIGSSQQIFAGLYYMESLETDVQTLAEQVTSSSRGWDAIYAVAVGNEWVNSGTYDAGTVASAVSKGRSLLSSQGFNGKVVTVDTVPAYQSNPSLCEASDFAAVNQHAFWNGNTAPEDSGSFIQNSISSMKSLCNKDVLICETGWPTQGSTYGSQGIPGTSQQLAAVKSIAEAVGEDVIFFTTFNDPWKQPGAYGVEQYWGLFD